MQTLLEAIAAKRDRLDRLRPLSPEALGNLEHYYDLEITYSSNAIEGNMLIRPTWDSPCAWMHPVSQHRPDSRLCRNRG